MSRYRRERVPGGTHYFTVVTEQRRPVLDRADARAALRAAIDDTRASRPFHVDAWVLLPDHLHCIWTLPEGDDDFSLRWNQIKRMTTWRLRGTPALALADHTHDPRIEGRLWQRCFREHCIRDDADFERHVDYIHFNPVKHGHVTRVADWPHSTFHRYVRAGLLPSYWGGEARLREIQVQGE